MIPEKLSPKDFQESLRLSPRLVVELVVEDKGGRIALIERQTPPFEGHWHLPGGFLLKGEHLSECTARLAEDELGTTLGPGEFLGLFENIAGDPRGHLLHYIERHRLEDGATISGEKISWFDRLPDKIIPYHREFLQQLGFK